jgi:hypothetical protein
VLRAYFKVIYECNRYANAYFRLKAELIIKGLPKYKKRLATEPVIGRELG